MKSFLLPLPSTSFRSRYQSVLAYLGVDLSLFKAVKDRGLCWGSVMEWHSVCGWQRDKIEERRSVAPYDVEHLQVLSS